jgi:organic hydroperoxide reductase OsmC/OhrA
VPTPAASRWRSRSSSATRAHRPSGWAVTAECTLDEVDGAPRITSVDLSVRAVVPGLDAGKFERMVGRAEDLCPVSNALHGNVRISVRHELEGARAQVSRSA